MLLVPFFTYSTAYGSTKNLLNLPFQAPVFLIKIIVFAKTLYTIFQAFVPPDAKDKDYWAKREKNNIAARRSREARRLKENQIALRTAFLEKENHQLKIDLEKAKAENIGKPNFQFKISPLNGAILDVKMFLSYLKPDNCRL